MKGLGAWFRSRSRREQGLILLMLALAAALLAWLLIVRPLAGMREEARERHREALLTLAAARGQADDLRQLEARPQPPAAGPVEAVVARAAAEAGFQLSRLDPRPNGSIQIAMEAAKAEALFAWLQQLEAARGLIVERVEMRANGDGTVALQAAVRRRG